MRPIRSFVTGSLAIALLAGAGSLSAASGAPARTVTGTVRLVIVDGSTEGRGAAYAATRGELRTHAVLDVGGRLLDLPASESAGLTTGDVVTATTPSATASTATDVRQVQRVSATHVKASATARSVAGAHTLTVLPVYWSTPDDSAPVSLLSTLAAATAEYWAEQSGGRIAITTQVRDWTRITDPRSCNPSALANAALAAHEVPLPSSANDHVMVYFPRREDCGGWAGLGQVTGPLIWDNGYPLLDVLTHEFGHNLGLGHANTATCTSGGSRVMLSSSCNVQEYRDYADVMGIAADAPTGSLNTALADTLGLAQTVTAPPGTRTIVDLAPLTNTAAVRALRIRLTSAWLYVDYRPAVGRDQRVPAWAGVQAHLLRDADIPASQLLDGQPGLVRAFTAPSLPVGSAWAVPGTGLSVTVTSMTSAAARVEIAPTDTIASLPAPAITAPANRAVVGSSTSLTWRVRSKVTSIQVFVDGQQVSSVPATALTGTVRVAGLSEGAHTLALRSAGSAGQTSPLSTTVAVTTDLTPPTTPIGLALSSSQILSWQASRDAAAGVNGYLVSLDGATPTRRGTSTTFAVQTPTGRHTWWVAAVDRVGNASPATGLIVDRASSPAGARAKAVRIVSATEGSQQRTLVAGRTVGASTPV